MFGLHCLNFFSLNIYIADVYYIFLYLKEGPIHEKKDLLRPSSVLIKNQYFTFAIVFKCIEAEGK